VKYIRYSIGQDWTAEWATFFRVMLSDEAARNQPGDMFPHFNFRSESEQAKQREPAWDPLPS
jgi:hypothetical protein